MTDLLRIALSIVALFVLFVVILLSLPGSPFSLKALNLRRGVVGCNRMFVLLASLVPHQNLVHSENERVANGLWRDDSIRSWP